MTVCPQQVFAHRAAWSGSRMELIDNVSRSSHSAASSLSLSPRTARELAFRVLVRYQQTGSWVQEELTAEFERSHWSQPDRRLVTELVCGVIRRQAALTSVLQPLISRPWDRVEPDLVTLLWLGAYQLLYLDRVPPFAAIHETVEIARTIGQARWTGFANGILRNVSRSILPECGTQPAANALPLSAGRYRLLDRSLFPEPAGEWNRYVARAFSLPDWLADRWAARFDRDTLVDLACAVNASPRVLVRVNRRRTTPEALQALWKAAGISSEPVGEMDALQLADSGPIEALPGFEDGLFSPQDLTAMQAAPRLAPAADDRVWDVCAAPGTKTCHLAELRDDHGTIIATDVHPERLSLIAAGAERLGLTSIQPRLIRDDLSDLPEGPFDAILIDAPCSNTGVLHRRPEARWRLRPDDPAQLSQIQTRLLLAAAERLSGHGRLLYSTCSIEPEENGQVVAALLARHPDLRLLSEQALLPGLQGDGGYQALVGR